MDIKRGDIVGIKFKVRKDNSSVQGGSRPCVVIQNNKGNEHSPTTIVCPVTHKIKSMHLPTHMVISGKDYNLDYNEQLILAEQVFTVDKKQIIRVISTLNDLDKKRLDDCVKISILKD